MITLLIVAAVLTCLIELPIVYMATKNDKLNDLFLNIILVNLITNLTLNVSNLLIQSNMFVYSAELIIPAIEAVMYQYCYPKISIVKWLGICYVANAISFGLGLLIL